MAESKPKAASDAERPGMAAARKSSSRRRSASARRQARKASPRRRQVKQARRGNGRAAGLLAKGRSALSGAYDWAGEAGASMPLPSQRSVQSVIDERPLLVGAVGLGIGVILGAFLPSLQARGGSGRRHRSSR